MIESQTTYHFEGFAVVTLVQSVGIKTNISRVCFCHSWIWSLSVTSCRVVCHHLKSLTLYLQAPRTRQGTIAQPPVGPEGVLMVWPPPYGPARVFCHR